MSFSRTSPPSPTLLNILWHNSRGWSPSLTIYNIKNAYILSAAVEMLLCLDSYTKDRLCGLVVRVPGYRSRSSGYDSRRYQIFWEVAGLERDSLSLVRIIEELFERKVAAPV
jgi:hypothetical protein